jgi:hypothetical protein
MSPASGWRDWGSSRRSLRPDYLPPTGTLVVEPPDDPIGTLTPTLTVPPPARMPSLAATVAMNVFTIVLRYRFKVAYGVLGT